MKIQVNTKCVPNERNDVTISDESPINVGDVISVIDYDGKVLYKIPIENIKNSFISNNIEVDHKNGEVSLFVGEPVLDVMINSDEKSVEYVSGGQALSQAIAYKKANPQERVIFVGNFGALEDGSLDNNGRIIKEFLESIGIEVKCALVKDKKTRHNYVVMDENGRTIFNPIRKEERPNISNDFANDFVKSILDEYKDIKTIGLDGSLEQIIKPLVLSNPNSIIEVDAGRKTKEQQEIVQYIHTIFEEHNDYYDKDELHILASRSYANELLHKICGTEKYSIIEDGKSVDINSKLIRLIQMRTYPSSLFGVTIGSYGCLFVDEDGVVNYLPSYVPETKDDDRFKDNSAGDTFHALLLSAISKKMPLALAYQYATVGTSVAGYGVESTAKMNTPTHDEIMDIIESRNPFYATYKDDVIEWVVGVPRNINGLQEKTSETKKKIVC